MGLRLRFLLVAVVALSGAGLLRAQETPVDESVFWASLALTQTLLDRQGDPEAALSDIRALWQNVEAVRLSDGTVVRADMAWLGDAQADDLEAARQGVRALLNYRAQQVRDPVDTEAALAVLARVLDDPRFRYPDATPTPVDEPAIELPDTSVQLMSPQLGQLVLIALGVAAVGAALVYFMRVRPAAAEAAPDSDGDPTTSDAAGELATSSEAARDYRSAIRYLYLACLLLLDERGLIRYDPALTNREHLRQIAGQPQLLDLLRPVVHTFDHVWYGFAPVDATLYGDFRRRVERLQQLAG